MRLFSVAKRSKYKQLFRERLSYKRWKAHAKMSKVIMGNGVFTIAWANLKLFQRGGRKQHRHMYSFFLVPCCWIILNLNQASQTLTTHNANRHCRVRFNTFVGQPLSKQLYYVIKHANPYLRVVTQRDTRDKMSRPVAWRSQVPSPGYSKGG